MTDLLVVMLWQVVVIGGWALSRRLLRLERSHRSPCYGQVGALREQVVELRTDQAFDSQEQARRLRDVETAVTRAEAELRRFTHQHEQMTRTLGARLARLERSLDPAVEGGPKP